MSLINQIVKIIQRSQPPAGEKKVQAPTKQPIAPQKETVQPSPKAQSHGTPQITKEQQAQVQAQLQAQLHQAQTQAKEIVLEAKDEAIRIKADAEREVRQKLEQLERKLGVYDERERQLKKIEDDANKVRAEIQKQRDDLIIKLEKAASLTRDEAKNLILTRVEERLHEEIAKRIKEAEQKAKESAEIKAREILVDAMRFGATDYVPEYTVSTVKIPDDDIKGRIIGKEGRNIRTFEQVTGVDVDLDEEGVIRLSSFDSVRREIARVALEKLITDGRIQPSRIEEIVEQTRKEIERIMFREGEKLCHSVGVYNLPRELISLLGRFKYRYSYGQNMIAHTTEETKIGIALAHELKADVNVVRLGCLMHDIGKVITEGEGTHVQLGVEILKKYGMPQKVVDCVEQHHEDTPFTAVESIIVYIADAISGSRPGARYEDIGEYIKRLQDLENIAKTKDGVKEAFAIQAGREVRVIVDPGKVSDAETVVLAQTIKEEIEKKMTFPGQIKVNVIRELRATEVAQ